MNTRCGEIMYAHHQILQQARKLPGIHEIFLFYFEMLLGNRVGNEHISKEVILCQSSGKSLNM